MSVFILFYAFGTTNDKEIVQMCSLNDQKIKSKIEEALSNFKEYYYK